MLIIVLNLLFLFQKSVCYDYKELYFLQKVDHFGYKNQDLFHQRYFINYDSYDAKNGSIFFYTGNEGNIEMFMNNSGFMWESAEKFKALLVFAEHRYYGKSMPYGNDCYKDNDRLGYLSSEQALADYAVLISYLRNLYPGAPLIAFGGSYGGMLAAWIRTKYPHLVDGAVASSAPIHHFPGMVPCDQYNAVITQDFINSSPNCAKNIRKSWDTLQQLGQTEAGLSFLSKAFKLCSPLNASRVNALRDWLSGTWGYLAMTDYPYPTFFLNPLPAYPIRETCRFLSDGSLSGKTLMVQVAFAAGVFHNHTGQVDCNDLNNGGGADLGETGWNYQACTEMVMPMCQNGKTDMFWPQVWNWTEVVKDCVRQFQVKPDPHKAAIMYGGKNITASSNIIFSNGRLDPWHVGGILETLSDSLIAIMMDNAAHHLDLRASNPADPKAVIKARQTIVRYLHKWTTQARLNLRRKIS